MYSIHNYENLIKFKIIAKKPCIFKENVKIVKFEYQRKIVYLCYF